MIGPHAHSLRHLIDASPDGYALVAVGKVQWLNRALGELSGESDPSTLLGRPWADLFVDAGFGLPLSRSVIECGLVRPGLEPFPVSVDHLAFEDGGEGDEFFQSFRVRDLRPQRTLEDEVLRSGRRLHAINRELASTRERLQHEASERDEMLNVISHELRTPVTVINGYNRLLLDGEVGELNETQRRFLRESQKSCQRLDHFLENLIEAAGKGIATGPLEVREDSIEERCRAVAAMLGPLLVERRLEIRVDCAPALPRLRLDPRRIEQVLVNLTNNAARMAPHGSEIVFEVRPAERGPERHRGIAVAVCDGGPGVPTEDRERIFAPYVQSVSSRQQGGLGLGLAICRRIVEAHGGEIALDGSGTGTRVVFWLPLRAAAWDEPGEVGV